MNALPLQFATVRIPGLEGDGLSLEIPPHAAVSVVGSEWSGVDALGRYALALVQPPAGHVLVYGEDISRMTRRATLAFRRRGGSLPADTGLLPTLALRDNVALPMQYGSEMTEREIEGRLRILLAQLRLTEVAHRRPADVTEEERRRAGAARAVAFDPELVILEDPFDGLTTRAAAELLEIFRGGETEEGARRTVFITGQAVPQRLEPWIETRFRIRRGKLEEQT
jgi:ABC-type transporter Mla maintaining outer membrane lipid asymmetry ATPase subunit MlaF